MKHWLKRASEPSRTKQGTQTPRSILQVNRPGQQAFGRENCEIPRAASGLSRALAGGGLRLRRGPKREVEHPLERGGAAGEAA